MFKTTPYASVVKNHNVSTKVVFQLNNLVIIVGLVIVIIWCLLQVAWQVEIFCYLQFFSIPNQIDMFLTPCKDRSQLI